MSARSRLPAAGAHDAEDPKPFELRLKARQPGAKEVHPAASTVQHQNRRSLLPQISQKPQYSSRSDMEPMGRIVDARLEENPIDGPAARTFDQAVAAERNINLVTPAPQDSQVSKQPPVRMKSMSRTVDSGVPLRQNPGFMTGQRPSVGDSKGKLATKASHSSNVGKRLADEGSSLKRTSSVKTRSTGDHPSMQSRTTTETNSIPRKHIRASSTSTVASNAAGKRNSRLMEPPRIEARTKTQVANRMPQTPPGSSSNATDAKPRTQMLPPPRTTFNTFQKHYSPAKSSLPKPPVPASRSSRAPSETEADVPISSDVALQQIELLQLSLLHQASMNALLEFEASAFNRLTQRHARLRQRYGKISHEEARQRKLRNVEALDGWCPDHALLSESLTTLCRIVQELSVLTESDGKFNEVVLAFSDWISQSDAPDMLAPLQQDWRTSHASLALKLRSLQRLSQTLPPVPSYPQSTSLWDLSWNCNNLIDGMLRELDVLVRLENQILKSHKLRIDREVEHHMLIEAPPTTAMSSWTPVWETEGSP